MGKKSFIGRKNESAYLKNAIEKRNKGILVYGPRQVGKTALIIDVLENQMQTKYIYYECVKGSFQYNVELFAKTCAEATGLEYIARMRDIFDIFDVLNESTSGKHIIVVIDEYPYMRSSLSKDTLDSYMQRIIDTSRNLSIIFSGSWMRKNSAFPAYTKIIMITSCTRNITGRSPSPLNRNSWMFVFARMIITCRYVTMSVQITASVIE